MTTQTDQTVDGRATKVALERRFDDFGWGVLLIAIGTIWLLPETHVPHGTWLIAAGIILLGLNAARFFSGISMSGFSLVVGILALIAGLGEFFGVGVPLFPIALIVIGALSLLKPLLDKNSSSAPGRGWRCCAPPETGK
jgi:hypothetical protein